MHMLRNATWYCLLVIAAGASASPCLAQGGSAGKRYAIAIHGGAGGSPKRLTPEARAARLKVLENVLQDAVNQLERGAHSLDVVERVIRRLEDHPQFNAGRGAVMNAKGEFELDASIMDGRDRSCGAVAAVRTVKNPISLARLVMTKTRHVLLVSDGAETFADTQGVERRDAAYFRTEARQKAFEKRAKKEAEQAVDAKGTVGCAVLDSHGDIAAGTSTGGLMFKKYGRVGDSPIVGAGCFADNATCGVSATGIGEQFIRNAICYDISARMRYAQQSLPEAAKSAIHETLRKGDGGVIAVSRDGDVAMEFNTEGMARAAANSQGLRIIKLD